MPNDLTCLMTIVSLVHSFTIDVDDPMLKEVFSPAELEEMDMTNTKEDPELSADLYSHLAKYYDKVGEKHAVNVRMS
ncbi:hypothetical protein C1646_61668 [Rhizophagus diaphanus]|nr:hypothetical protein C1646_61668 [Rhizophagus diaphanus] [Rhizophagus sp. MUCL 43196]